MKETKHLLVYGSLMKRFEHPMYKTLEDHADFVSAGTFQGQLYRIDWYPGAVKSTNPKDRVHGEIYELKDPDKALSILDEFEAFDPRNLEGSEFVREATEVIASSGEKFDCFIYLFNHSIEKAKLIDSGKFLSL